MKITENIKKYVIRQMDEVRSKIDEENRASYEARRQSCIGEIRTILQVHKKEIEDVITKYNMDMTWLDTQNVPETILGFSESCIKNEEENSKYYDDEFELHKKQNKLIEEFLVECDLECDKEEFFKMLEELKKKL